MNITIPIDVAPHAHKNYQEHYQKLTFNNKRIILFSCDQKIEHLNYDFYGHNIDSNTLHPEHLFNIASQGTISAMATHLGFIARYGAHYKDIHYIVKLNGKTPLVNETYQDPLSTLLWNIDNVIAFKEQSQLPILGVGLTIYPGSTYESSMLAQAAQAIFHAHQYGLITILWVYPRGKSITQEQDPQLLAGAAGLANALGSDFVKIKPPIAAHGKSIIEWLNIITTAAGNTGVLCSGGPRTDQKTFLTALYEQIHVGKCAGSATGRNIFQLPLAQAIAMTHAIYAIAIDNVSVDSAYESYIKKSL